MAVVSLANAEKIGFVDGAMIDASAQRILGLRIRSGGVFTHRRALLLEDVTAIGTDALTVQDPGHVNQEDAFSTLKGATDIADVVGSKVITQGGTAVGSVADIDFDAKSGQIQTYVLRASLVEKVRRQEHRVPSTAVRRIGNNILVVENGSEPDNSTAAK